MAAGYATIRREVQPEESGGQPSQPALRVGPARTIGLTALAAGLQRGLAPKDRWPAFAAVLGEGPAGADAIEHGSPQGYLPTVDVSPRTLDLEGYRMRLARRSDLPEILAMLLDDHLGARREDPRASVYVDAFDAIVADPSQELWVVDDGRRVVGFLQLSFIRGIAHQGATRAQIESVRVLSELRGQGVGTAFLRGVLRRAEERGAYLAQLSTDKSRKDAFRFYERLGFVASHEGMKKPLGGRGPS